MSDDLTGHELFQRSADVSTHGHTSAHYNTLPFHVLITGLSVQDFAFPCRSPQEGSGMSVSACISLSRGVKAGMA